MLNESNTTIAEPIIENAKYLQSFSTVKQTYLPGEFLITDAAKVNDTVTKAVAAFGIYKLLSPAKKAIFLETIAEEIMLLGEVLIERAMLETGLPQARL